jgi:hypothetical protein
MVDVLIGPALGRHGVDEANFDPGEALRHGGNIADDIGDAQVVPGLLPIGRARPTHLRQWTLEAEEGDAGAQVKEALDCCGLVAQAAGMVRTLGVGGAGHVHRQGDAPCIQCWQERIT